MLSDCVNHVYLCYSFIVKQVFIVYSVCVSSDMSSMSSSQHGNLFNLVDQSVSWFIFNSKLDVTKQSIPIVEEQENKNTRLAGT